MTDEEILLGREVAIDLRGYDSKLTRMDSLLHREVESLLERFINAMKKTETQPNFLFASSDSWH